MNQYSQLLYYIKQLAEQDNYINTVVKGGEDFDKANIYPIINVVIDNANFPSDAVVSFDVILECTDIRDINKEIVNDKFEHNDNEIDNHNNTFATLNRIWKIMKRDFNSNNITASENPSLSKITYEQKNLVDGWELSFTVQMPNTTLDLCQVTSC